MAAQQRQQNTTRTLGGCSRRFVRNLLGRAASSGWLPTHTCSGRDADLVAAEDDRDEVEDVDAPAPGLAAAVVVVGAGAAKQLPTAA